MAIMTWNRNSISIAIFLASLLLFVPFLGGSHLFDWDEVNFAEAAREMLVTGEFTYVQINFRPFWEKPPLFIWMQAASMSMFGVNEFAARFPNAICGAITLVLLFNIGHRLVSTNFGLLWVLVYAGSLLPQFYFRSGIIDPWFNLFIFGGVLLLIKASETERINRRDILLSAVLIGLAVMTKGPTALGLVGITVAVYFISSFKKHKWNVVDPIIYLFIVFLVGFSWFFVEVLRGRGYVVQEFIDYHIRLFSESEAGHGQPFFYHPLVLLVGCFPMSLFVIFGWSQKTARNAELRPFTKWMNILFWVVLIAFSIVKTKIIHYSSLTYFPLSFLASWSAYQLIKGNWKFRFPHLATMLLFICLLGTAFVLLGILNEIKEPLLTFLEPNTLAHGNFSQQIPDGILDPFIGLIFLLCGMSASFLTYLGKSRIGIIGLFATSLITVALLSIVIVPKIDRYNQSELFKFYEQKAETSYLQPLGFHSYAHLFYGKKKPIPTETDDELKWMIFEKVDRPVYFISRLEDVSNAQRYFPWLKVVDQKGGYAILQRTDENYPFLEAP